MQVKALIEFKRPARLYHPGRNRMYRGRIGMCYGPLASRRKPMVPCGVKIAIMILLPAMLSAACHAQQPAAVTAGPGIFYGSVDGYDPAFGFFPLTSPGFAQT